VVDEYRQRRPSFAVWEKRNQPVIFANEKWVYDGKAITSVSRLACPADR